MYLKSQELTDLEDIFIRLLLRNIAFLHTTNRYNEISYIQEQIKAQINIKNNIPDALKQFMTEELSKNSKLHNISEELILTKKEDTLKTCSKLVRELKK